MDDRRQEDLATLVNLGNTCKKIRAEVRVILFRCIRVSSLEQLEAVPASDWTRFVRCVAAGRSRLRHRSDIYERARSKFWLAWWCWWQRSFCHLVERATGLLPPTHSLATLVHNGQALANTPNRTLIIDLSMFDGDTDEVGRPGSGRQCWDEAALLIKLLRSLPRLEHLSFFADASDDSTMALLFSNLIPYPDLDTAVSSPPTDSAVPFAQRIKSFGWRQRGKPPPDLRDFSRVSPFVSSYHLLRNAPNLSFLVLDADLDLMLPEDVADAMRELAKRRPRLGESFAPISLMLCGPIAGWQNMIQQLGPLGKDIQELFIDRPVLRRHKADEVNTEKFVKDLEPLKLWPRLQLLQVGSYPFVLNEQRMITTRLARALPSLLVLGLLGEEEDTCWWGVWNSPVGEPVVHPLGDGHLDVLEESTRKARQPSYAFGIEAITRSRRSSIANDLSLRPQSLFGHPFDRQANFIAEHTIQPILGAPGSPGRRDSLAAPMWTSLHPFQAPYAPDDTTTAAAMFPQSPQLSTLSVSHTL